jgi:hypothetical protein
MLCVGVDNSAVTSIAGGVNGGTGTYSDNSGTDAGFDFPWGVVVDASGNVFVADTNNNRIRTVTPDGGTRVGPVALRACILDLYFGALA